MAIDSEIKRRRALRSVLGKSLRGFPSLYIPEGYFLVGDRYQRGGVYYIDTTIAVGDKVVFVSANDAENRLEVDTPLWGYTTSVLLPLTYSQKGNGQVGVFDAGTEYDARVCKCIFQLDKTTAEEFIRFFRDPLAGRGNNIVMELPINASGERIGWFPFGPDYGDYGRFIVHVLNVKPSPQLMEPFLWWEIEIEIVYNSGPSPAFSLPSPVDYGTLQIGTVTTLRYPESTFQSTAIYGINETVLFGGNVGTVDNGAYADSWKTTFELQGTRSKITELINYLVTVPRDPINKTYSPISIVTLDNQFMFGLEGAAADDDGGNTYSAQLLNKEIIVTHIDFDLYNVTLEFLMVEKL